MFSYRKAGGTRNLVPNHNPGKNTLFHFIQTEMTAGFLLRTLMFFKSDLIMMMNHSEAQVFWKVRNKV